MAKTYKPTFLNKICCYRPSRRDWLPENHLAYCVSDVVDQLELSAIESVYEEEDRGQPHVSPAHDDQDPAVRVLRGGVFLSPDSETSGGRRGNSECWQPAISRIFGPYRIFGNFI